jgi:nitroreductase
MEIIDLLCTRRSIRKYTPKLVSEELVSEILKAGMYAPSARNQRPWHFIIVRDKETLKAITHVHPFSGMLTQASLAIVVCVDLDLEESEGYWVQDCAAATQNILLAAHSLGLGSVWLGVHPREERSKGLKELFKLNDRIMPFSIVSIGYPAEEKPLPDRFDTNRIHYEKW